MMEEIYEERNVDGKNKEKNVDERYMCLDEKYECR